MNLLRFYSFIAAGLSLREEADPDIQQVLQSRFRIESLSASVE
jgi:hypothetical protein